MKGAFGLFYCVWHLAGPLHLESKETPSTFIVFEEVIWLAPTLTETPGISSLWKRQISVLFSLTFSPESLSQEMIILRSISSSGTSAWRLMLDLTVKLSSAKFVRAFKSKIGETYIAKRNGPSMELCLMRKSPNNHRWQPHSWLTTKPWLSQRCPLVAPEFWDARLRD